jgi:sugar phosphate isomerase/epimerase
MYASRTGMMRRREFLIGAVAAQARLGAQDNSEKLKRVGCMSGCFSRLLKETRDWSQPVSPKELDIMDFPEMLADRYHIHNVEVQQFHFLSPEPSYFRKFLERVKKVKSRMIDMPLELDESGYSGTVSPCSADPQIRARAVELTKQWIDRAAMIECPSVMINQGMMLPDDLAPVIDALKTLSAYGKSRKVAVIMENRGRTPPETLARVIRASGTYANPDIGNFPDEETRERGLRLLYPLSITVSHVKMNPARFDFAKAIGISKEMGFQGVYSLETGGPDPYAAAQTVLDALLSNM